MIKKYKRLRYLQQAEFSKQKYQNIKEYQQVKKSSRYNYKSTMNSTPRNLQIKTTSDTIGNVQPFTTDYMHSTQEPSPSFLDFLTKQILLKRKQDSIFSKDFDLVQRIVNACEEANKRNHQIVELNMKKLINLQIEVKSLKFQNQFLKTTNENEKKALTMTIESLKKQFQSLKDKNIRINTIQKNRMEVQQKKIKDELATKEIQLQKLQKDLSISQAHLNTVAKNFIDTLNNSSQKEKKIRLLTQNDDANSCIKFCINEVQKINEKFLSISNTQASLINFLKSSIKTVQLVQTAQYGPIQLKEGQAVQIFKLVRQDIEKKVTEKLKIKKGEQSPFSELIRFLQITDSLIKDLLLDRVQALKQANTNISSLTNQNQKLTQYKDQYKVEIQELKENKKRLQAQKVKLQTEVEGERKKRKQTEEKLEEALRQIQKFKFQIEQLKGEIQKLQKQIRQKDQSISNLDNQIDKKEKEINQKNIKILNFEDQIENLNKNLRTVQNNLDNYIKKNKQIEQQNTRTSTIIIQKQEDLQLLKKQKNQLNSYIEKLHNQLKVTKRQLTASNQTILQHFRTLNEREGEIKEHLQSIQKAKQSIKELELQKYKLQSQWDDLLKNPPRECLQYFNGNILNITTRPYVEWFIQNFEKYMGRKIRSTRPLYRLDTNNKTPFHTYIDNNPNIVLILKMSNGQIIVGYSDPAFVPKTNVEFREGYIFGLRNKKIFKTKKEATNKMNRTNPKPITYDEFFIIWGNSDLRIKPASKELYTGYATPNASYEEIDNPNSTVLDLFEQEERDAFLVDYEFFQVLFEDE